MQVLAVSNNKGGVGKTTLALHLGVALAEQGRRLLLVDADPQATLTRWLLGPEPTVGLSELIANDYGTGVLIEDAVATTEIPNVDLLPAGQALEVAYGQMQGLAVHRLRDAIDDLHTPYELVIVDSPPRLGSVAEALLVAADAVLHPVDGGSESIVALQKLGKTVDRVRRHRPSLSVLGFVVAREQETATQRAVNEALLQIYGDAPVQSSIPWSAFVPRAQAGRATVFDLARRNKRARPCADAYRKVASSIAEVML